MRLTTLATLAILWAPAAAQEAPNAPWSALVPKVEGAKHHYIATDGKPGNPGSKDAPWDLVSAIGGAQKSVAPGDVLWVRAGTYKGNPEVEKGKLILRLAGKPGAPVHLRAYPGERATILDTTLWVMEPATHVWIWDLELAGSIPVDKRVTQQTGSHPSDLPGGDGMNVYAGKDCRFINLFVHDTLGNGVSWWIGSVDSEIHGCVIFGNGWKAPDRGHGHSIYTQNQNGTKTISNCIMTAGYDGAYTMHAYGSSKAYVDNYVIEDNVAYERGPFLVGGGRPSRNIVVRRNLLNGVSMQIGYSAPENEDCEVRDNVIAWGKLSIRKYKKAVEEGNLLDSTQARSVVIPNKYDPTRAHVALYNASKAPECRIAVGAFLKPGEKFRLLAARDLFGKPVLEGACDGPHLTVPMSGDFAAFVLVKQ